MYPSPRPEGMSDDHPNRFQKEYEQYEEIMEQQQANTLCGRPLPFTKTPRGRLGFDWTSIDGQNSYVFLLLWCVRFIQLSRRQDDIGSNKQGGYRFTRRVYLQISGTQSLIL